MIPIDDGVASPPAADRPVASTYTPILVAAPYAFNEHGYHGASLRDIARRIGVNVPSLYYHHENKENMLFELLLTSMLHLEDKVRAACDSSTTRGRSSGCL